MLRRVRVVGVLGVVGVGRDEGPGTKTNPPLRCYVGLHFS